MAEVLAGLEVVAEVLAEVVAEVLADMVGVAGVVVVADAISVVTSPLNNIKSVCPFKVIFRLLPPIFLLR